MKKQKVYHFIRILVMLLGAGLGGGMAALGLRIYSALSFTQILSTFTVFIVLMVFTFLFAIMTWFLAPRIIKRVEHWSGQIEVSLSETPFTQILSVVFGLLIGLSIATLTTQLFRPALPQMLWTASALIIYLLLGYIGAHLGARRWRDFASLLSGRQSRAEKRVSPSQQTQASISKILDTSVIIDGRIFDICKTGFVEGPLVAPQFILAELRHIADSSDPLRRERGRRGLDVLARIQKELDIEVIITDMDFEDVEEVDVKLLKLAQQMNAVVVTNDFNLNKVANVTGVKVLNINDLAGALRPVLLPGEEMQVQVLREGKELGQGVGYLEDGTMIVVDNGKRYIGETVDVVVTTVLQTSAGRMIFTRVKQVA